MKKLRILLLPAMLATLPLIASADPWKHEGDHGRGRGHGHGHGHKETYWEGNCKVERKIKKHGEIKEKRECMAPHPAHVVMQPAPVVVQPAPVIVRPAPAVVVPAPQPGITIHGTVRLP